MAVCPIGVANIRMKICLCLCCGHNCLNLISSEWTFISGRTADSYALLNNQEKVSAYNYRLEEKL